MLPKLIFNMMNHWLNLTLTSSKTHYSTHEIRVENMSYSLLRGSNNTLS